MSTPTKTVDNVYDYMIAKICSGQTILNIAKDVEARFGDQIPRNEDMAKILRSWLRNRADRFKVLRERYKKQNAEIRSMQATIDGGDAGTAPIIDERNKRKMQQLQLENKVLVKENNRLRAANENRNTSDDTEAHTTHEEHTYIPPSNFGAYHKLKARYLDLLEQIPGEAMFTIGNTVILPYDDVGPGVVISVLYDVAHKQYQYGVRTSSDDYCLPEAALNVAANSGAVQKKQR